MFGIGGIRNGADESTFNCSHVKILTKFSNILSKYFFQTTSFHKSSTFPDDKRMLKTSFNSWQLVRTETKKSCKNVTLYY